MRKLKYLALIIAFAIIPALFIGCTARNTSDDADLPRLVIGSDDFRPYYYLDADGDYAGIDVELAQEACSRIGYEAIFKEISWDEKDSLLASGDIDCIWGCFQMDGYENDYQWVGPYMNSYQAVAVLPDSCIQTLADLKAKNVAIVSGSPLEGTFLNHTDERIPDVKSLYCLSEMDEAVIALRNEYVDAIAGHTATLYDYMENASVEYRLLPEKLQKVHLGVAFYKGADSDVCLRLGEALADMKADGTIAAILHAYGLDAKSALVED